MVGPDGLLPEERGHVKDLFILLTEWGLDRKEMRTSSSGI